MDYRLVLLELVHGSGRGIDNENSYESSEDGITVVPTTTPEGWFDWLLCRMISFFVCFNLIAGTAEEAIALFQIGYAGGDAIENAIAVLVRDENFGIPGHGADSYLRFSCTADAGAGLKH